MAGRSTPRPPVGILLLIAGAGLAGLLVVSLDRRGRAPRADAPWRPPAEGLAAESGKTVTGAPAAQACPPPGQKAGAPAAPGALKEREGVGETIVKPIAAPPPELPAQVREGPAGRFAGSEKVIARSGSAADRRRLARHVRRFSARSRPVAGAAPSDDEEGAWVDPLLEALQAGGAVKADPLAIPEPERTRQRCLEQLEKLRQRNAVGLLDHIQGGLAWLALHQAADGRFSEPAAAARCRELGHDPPCVRKASKRYAIPVTALAVMALLDFRDQDARGLFEPHLAAGVRWLLSRQRGDGSFHGGRQLYTNAIALLALAQAAASTGDEKLRGAVRKGLALFDRSPGPLGGYRYSFGAPGDLSVTGWVAQAVEMARRAGVEVPPTLEAGLRQFLAGVWRGEHRFVYQARSNERGGLFPVGMLMGHLLWRDPEPALVQSWRAWLTKGVGEKRPSLYTLYYGVRVAIVLEEKLPEPWRGWVFELAQEQTRKDTAAGAFQIRKDPWLGKTGTICQTAMAVLTLEHSLYLR